MEVRNLLSEIIFQQCLETVARVEAWKIPHPIQSIYLVCLVENNNSDEQQKTEISFSGNTIFLYDSRKELPWYSGTSPGRVLSGVTSLFFSRSWSIVLYVCSYTLKCSLHYTPGAVFQKYSMHEWLLTYLYTEICY